MHSRALLPALALLALLAAGAGCTANPATDQSVTAVGTGGALTAPEVLASFVPPAPAGWRLLAPPSPVTLDEGGVPIASVTATYLPDGGPNRTGGTEAEVTVQDTGGRPVGLRRLVDALAASTDGSPTRTSLRGQPAFVLGDGPVPAVYLVVADRYVVRLAVTNGTRADLDAFIAALDIEGLAGRR